MVNKRGCVVFCLRETRRKLHQQNYSNELDFQVLVGVIQNFDFGVSIAKLCKNNAL